jgi:hypothetical protein
MLCNIIERAFELARSGTVLGPDDIAKRLAHEGYPDVHQQLGGITIRKQLREICRTAEPSQ